MGWPKSHATGKQSNISVTARANGLIFLPLVKTYFLTLNPYEQSQGELLVSTTNDFNKKISLLHIGKKQCIMKKSHFLRINCNLLDGLVSNTCCVFLCVFSLYHYLYARGVAREVHYAYVHPLTMEGFQVISCFQVQSMCISQTSVRY